MKKNMLTRADMRRVEDWLAMNWDRISKTCKTPDDAAKLAVADLHFVVTGHNIDSACEIMGKPLLRTRQRGGGLQTMSATTATLIVNLYPTMRAMGCTIEGDAAEHERVARQVLNGTPSENGDAKV